MPVHRSNRRRRQFHDFVLFRPNGNDDHTNQLSSNHSFPRRVVVKSTQLYPRNAYRRKHHRRKSAAQKCGIPTRRNAFDIDARTARERKKAEAREQRWANGGEARRKSLVITKDREGPREKRGKKTGGNPYLVLKVYTGLAGSRRGEAKPRVGESGEKKFALARSTTRLYYAL